jgi:site-specific DNA-methyltransferase (adenine-specific)
MSKPVFEEVKKGCKLAMADSLSAMKEIEKKSVDLILTDPPYNLGLFMSQRDTNMGKLRKNHFSAASWDNLSFDEWVLAMDKFFKYSSEVVRDGGSMIVFMSLIKIETIISLAQKHGFYYKTTGIWHKTNPMPRNMNLHFVNSTEGWIFFTYKKRTGTFNNKGKLYHDFIESGLTPKNEKKYGTHPTQKPEFIISHFIELLTNKNDVVLDSFMGSGTTGKVALDLGRQFIGIEISKKYFEIAKNRILAQMSLW